MKTFAGLITLSLLMAMPVEAATVQSKSGVMIRVSSSARAAMQCVVDYVEAAGVRIKYMRGYGKGTVRHSLHPSGNAIDINQTHRDRTKPAVPRHVANAAADACGVVSGARWGYADNGHWNMTQTARGSRPARGIVQPTISPDMDVAARPAYPIQ